MRVTKAVLLAGGLGTRISEETIDKPKPMVEIGGRPIIWHVMKIYSHFGINEFIVCCGYKGYVIKEFFSNYFLHMADVTFDMVNNDMVVHQRHAEPWKITLVDTGDYTMTGGRLKRVREYVKNDPAFCFTYTDGLSDVDISALIEFHFSHGRTATLTAVKPSGRFGSLKLEGATVKAFEEKPEGDGAHVNGGFFVLSPDVCDLIRDDSEVWERKPLETLAETNQLKAFRHDGFWQPMDTLREKLLLEELWASGKAPWKLWA